MVKNYTIGLDIGTSSVGYAVHYENYELVKKNMKIKGNGQKKKVKKNFWGVRLFESGETAEATRMKRTARRRYTRRKNRLIYLQELFAEDMKQVDAQFFQRLEESFFVPEDKKNERHPIFATIEEEVAYHQDFPTIYHLRKYLADAQEQSDLRLVYLAIAHMIKYRGNFLIEGTLNIENTSVDENFKRFLQAYNQVFSVQEDGSLLNPVEETTEVGDLLQAKVSRQRKAENVLKMFPSEKSTGDFMQFLKLIVGNQGNFKKTFGLVEDFKLQFSKEEYEEKLEELLGIIGDDYAEIFLAAKGVYDAVELFGILTAKDVTTKAKLSASMVQRYQEHQEDLKLFKKFIKEKVPEKYFEIFNDVSKNGYAGYIDNGVKQEEFYKYIKKILEQVADATYFLEKIEKEDFLRKQRTFDNGVIPHQVHLEELKAIIGKQGRYYPFLRENKLKIEQLLTFRIPYYVGPLSQQSSRFSWVTRKSDEKIRPWNFNTVVDEGKTATDFIERMTNFDQYLPQEKVLPKHSMLYEKFAIFNELTKVSYVSDQGVIQNFSSAEKRDIFNELFKKNRKVKVQDLEDFLKNQYMIEVIKIQGIEKRFNASYGTYHDLLKIGISKEMLDDVTNEQMFEDIIKILTVFEDRKMIREQLSCYTPQLDSKVLKNLERRHYTGWGRLSAKMIYGLRDKYSKKTILDYLIEDDAMPKNKNRNFMQLINDDSLSFKEYIANEKILDDEADLHELVNNLAGSPAIKKGIVQSLKIVEEIVHIMGYPPRNIVVEMARENQTTSRGRDKSKERKRVLEESLKGLQDSILKDYPLDHVDLKRNQLFLYYLQNGKDMYTGLDLDINKLSSYDIDHIIPQSFIKDDSIDNLVLVSSSKNRGKTDNVPDESVVKKMRPYWEQLQKANLISKRKFDNLTKIERGGLTDEDKAHFIKRQLVETRQITKNVAQILHQKFNSLDEENTENRTRIITLKASLTSQFRQIFNLYKVREINDLHHGHDAYLNGVVANALLKVYPKLEAEFVYGDYQKFNSFKENKATAKKEFYSNLMRFFSEKEPKTNDGEILWGAQDISTVKKVMSYRQMNIVKKTETQTGGFSKESVLPKSGSDKLIERKNGWETQKYGGFDSPNIAYTVIISYEKGKKKQVTKVLVGITIMEQKSFEENEIQFLVDKGFSAPKIEVRLPKYTLYELENGRKRMIASASEAQKGNQMILPQHLVALLYHAKHCEELDQISYNYLINHRKDFDELFKRVIDFAEQFTIAEKNVQKLIDVFNKNSEADIKVIAQSFLNLMQFNAMGAPADFVFFGEKIPRKRYTSMKELLDGTIIHQSITGLYETHRKLGD
jgi:CRISPR-associated endonuclease Csn1